MAFFGKAMPRDPEGNDYVLNGGQIKGVGRLVGWGGSGENRTVEKYEVIDPFDNWFHIVKLQYHYCHVSHGALNTTSHG